MEGKGTSFFKIYCRFLEKITDDMYLELTFEETIKILDSLFLDSLPEFTYPRFHINDYDVEAETEALDENGEPILKGAFSEELTNEEQDIIAEIMLLNWIRRQLYDTRITRMRYSTSDFKQTSQAAHMQRLSSLVSSQQGRVRHKLNLYSRRKIDKDGYIVPNADNLSTVGPRRQNQILTSLGVVMKDD